MRLVIDEEISSIDNEIAQIRAGHHERLRQNYANLLKESDRQKGFAKARLIAAEHEIDRRFEAMVLAEWTRFQVLPSPSGH